MSHRPITQDDINAAYRGLQMRTMSLRELEELRYEHAHPDKPFASHVIAEAARQAINSRQYR